MKTLAGQEKRRKTEDKQKNVSDRQRRNRKDDREQEDLHAALCLDFYRGCKSDWNMNDKTVWTTIAREMQDQDIRSWISVVDKFFAKIKSEGK